jgi:hypothetical protein
LGEWELNMNASIRSFVRRLYDSTLAKIIFLISAIVTLASLVPMLNDPPVGISGAAPTIDRSSAGPLPATRRAAVQTSSGVQSPNVNGVQHDVRIQYRSTAVRMPDHSSEKTVRVRPDRTPSVIQTSYGAQSPNVNGVGGNVDIRFGYPAAESTKKSQEGVK